MRMGGRHGHPKNVGPTTSQIADTGGDPLQLGRRVWHSIPMDKADPPVPGTLPALCPLLTQSKKSSRCPGPT